MSTLAYASAPESCAVSQNTCNIHVDISDLSFQDDGIYYIPSYGPVSKVLALHCKTDHYIAVVPKSIIDDVFGVWWCWNCRHYNSKFDTACVFCGMPKNG